MNRPTPMHEEITAIPLPVAVAAGAVAVLAVHQPVLALLHRAGVAPWPAYSMQPTVPFGIPAFVSAALWGGAWAVPMHLIVRSAPTNASGWRRGALFGAVAPTAVGAVLIALGHGDPPPPGRTFVTATSGLAINLCWAIATIALTKATRGAGRADDTGACSDHR